MSVLSSPHYHDEAKAFAHLESIVWLTASFARIAVSSAARCTIWLASAPSRA
jgi:hypothetical protein